MYFEQVFRNFERDYEKIFVNQKGKELESGIQYDAEGNLSLYVDRNGNRSERQYNVLGNLVYEKATDEKGEHPCIRTYRYDCLNRLKEVSYGNGIRTRYEYDEKGEIKSLETG